MARNSRPPDDVEARDIEGQGEQAQGVYIGSGALLVIVIILLLILLL